MEIIDEKVLLGKILLPLNRQWSVSSVATNEKDEEIHVKLTYLLDYVEVAGVRYPIYDHRKLRKWRHLDLWQYKTFLLAELPRYKDEKGNFKTISVPWAQEYERVTELLEKKR
jgi:transposase